ncbi:hypothetical protein L3Q82_020315 [Scortum barcoo]|uniref:Uncharacterized protein n=1 Tax=Scortum barcoo TaxID=214431 RepID=A0ACB8V7B7_9TELE|nr:hypothetical protein L3Q82_020315 [Scortum barcoo]
MLPAVFQALVNDVLRDMLNKFVFVYLDDILIFSRNKEEHVHHVQAVLQRLLENSLFVKAEKLGRRKDQKLHPCAFFSKRLSPAERNYDIGNRELLAVKLALEEWRHWLEGSKQPFLVWTDHKNLEYIRSAAKRLNSHRQARWWSLFLTRFNFSLSYRPGSRNIKPDALSRQFQRDEDVAPCPDTIISSSHLVAPLTWEIEERVKAAQEGQPGPSACPQNRLFVPPSLRSDVLQWAHSSPSHLPPWDSENY